MRGDGWLQLRGGVYYAFFYHQGVRRKQSLRTGDLEVAKKRLVAIRRKRERQEYEPPAEARVTVDELLDDVITNLEVQGRAYAKKARSHVKPVREELGHLQARALDTAAVTRVAQEWLRDGAARATVNRRLELLRRAFRLAVRSTPPKVRAVPYFEFLRVDNVRRGFLEREEVERLLSHLDGDLADFTEWCYTTGMRKGEAAALTWPMLDRATWTLRIPAAICKNREDRTVPLVGTAKAIVDRRLKARRLDTPLVFHRTVPGGRAAGPGQPVKAFDLAWRAALKAAKLPASTLFHDLRRSAARNLRRAGATETEAMKVTGHKTASMFRRYSIVTDDDAAAALLKQDRLFGKKG